MTALHNPVSAFVCVMLLGGCGAAQQPERAASPRSAATTAAAASSPIALGSGQRDLDAGTYRVDLTRLAGGAEYPPFLVTVPDGWSSMDGWVLGRPTADGDGLSVAVSFWNVDEVYGHPCEWSGTLFQPGRGVDDLVAALLEVPMRDPTEPVAVEVDGRSGMFLEWSVPADLAVDERGDFVECDPTMDGHRDFKSWTGKGWASDRYHQGPGQVDRLWILDVDGQRLVIDAFSMPDASDEELEEMFGVVESIRLLDE